MLYVRNGGLGFQLTIGGPNIDVEAEHGLANEEVLASAILPRL